MSKLFLRCTLLSSILLLSACHHTMPQAEMTQPPIPNVSDAASTQIAESAASISASLTALEAVEKANMAPKAAKLYPNVAKMDMPGVSSIDWNGPIEPLLRQIAKAAGYKFKVIGIAPITPIIVTIHEQQASNAEITRNAALQANNRATVQTNVASKTLELRYLAH